MAMHAVAFSESQDAGGVLTYVAGVPDQSVRVTGDDITVPNTVNKIIWEYAYIGTTGSRALLVAPSLRRVNPVEIWPAKQFLLPTSTSLNNAGVHADTPIPLETNEALNCQIINDPAVAERATIIVQLSDGPIAPVKGNIRKVRFETTTAITAGAWVNAQINFVDDLPAGMYACVGAAIAVATGVFARWYPQGAPWRPGFPTNLNSGDSLDSIFRNGNLGKWFEFDQVTPPTIDILAGASTASATYSGVMDLIPL